MNIFFNRDEDRMRAGWRIGAQLFLTILIGTGLIVLLSSLTNISGPVVFAVSMAAGAVISMYLAARGLDKRPWSSYGLQLNKRWVLECGLGFFLAGLTIALIFLIEYAAGWIVVNSYGWEQQVANKTYMFAFFAYLGFMIVVGFYEEMVFRGYQIVNASEGLNGWQLSRRQAVWGAVALSSLIFGVAHAFNPNAGWLSTLNIALAGVMLAFPFIITGRLALSIGLHIGWNFFQGGVFGFPVSGIPSRSSLLQIQQSGPDFITGGAFGPEAGLLGLLGLGIIIAGVWVYVKNSGQSVAMHQRLGIYTPSARHYPA